MLLECTLWVKTLRVAVSWPYFVLDDLRRCTPYRVLHSMSSKSQSSSIGFLQTSKEVDYIVNSRESIRWLSSGQNSVTPSTSFPKKHLYSTVVMSMASTLSCASSAVKTTGGSALSDGSWNSVSKHLWANRVSPVPFDVQQRRCRRRVGVTWKGDRDKILE